MSELVNPSNIYQKATHQMAPGIRAVLLNKINEDNFSAVRIDMDPDAEFPWHVHPHSHFLICLNGEGVMETEFGEDHLSRDLTTRVAGNIGHALKASSTGLQIISFGPPKELEDPTRLVYWDTELSNNELYLTHKI